MEKAELWESAKYISWPHSMSSPVVRVPRPCGTPESKSFPMLAGDSEQALFDRCLAYRDQRGIEIWGETRWRQIVFVAKRSVAKRRSSSQTPRTGVHLENRTGRAPAWVAAWYELMQDGTRRKRSKRFSFGTDRAKYPTSNKALAAAIARRKQEEAKWYCVLAEPAGSEEHNENQTQSSGPGK